MRSGSISIQGQRSQNEDACFTRFVPGQPLIAAVADGMGGHAAGEVASRLSVEAMDICTREYAGSPQNMLSEAFTLANGKVLASSEENPERKGMGSTLVAALFYADYFITANVGDSRLYHIHENGMSRVTIDHSYVEELRMAGLLTEEQARRHPNRNWITRCVGMHTDFAPDFFHTSWKRGDTVLLCSDGLCGFVPEEDILTVILSGGSPDEICRELAETALLRGSTDNITAVIVKNEDSLQA